MAMDDVVIAVIDVVSALDGIGCTQQITAISISSFIKYYYIK
jgi:hypothetical protein